MDGIRREIFAGSWVITTFVNESFTGAAESLLMTMLSFKAIDVSIFCKAAAVSCCGS